jgi:DNA repair protein RecO
LFGRGTGVLRALAKGSKRVGSAFSGGIEVLARGRISFMQRPNSELVLLTEWDLEEIFPALRRALRPYHAGLYMADVVHHVVRDHDPHPRLFDALVAALRDLADPAAIPAALLRFQWETLVETGYKPVLEIDAATGQPLSPAPFYRFSPTLGGLLPDAVAGQEGVEGHSHDHRHPAWRVRENTVHLLQQLASEGNGSHPASAPATIERANRLLASYLCHLLGREPNTLRSVFPSRSTGVAPTGSAVDA